MSVWKIGRFAACATFKTGSPDGEGGGGGGAAAAGGGGGGGGSVASTVIAAPPLWPSLVAVMVALRPRAR